jgi:hypothetical protein
MAIQLSDGTLVFTRTTGSEATASNFNTFSTRVKTAHAVMRGFDIVFENGEHPVQELQAQLTATSIDPNNAAVVHVSGILFWRDSSGNIDDPYHGIIDYTVIADV